MKKICLIVSILLLSLLMAFSVGAKCASGCVYSTSPFCDVCGEQIEGECTGSHMFESGYCVICGAFDDSQEDWCPVNQGQHNVLLGSCTHCGKVFCYHTDMSGLHVVTKPTCKETGYGYRLCLDCGAEYGEVIAQTAHDYKNGVCIACGATSGTSCAHAYINGVCKECGEYDPEHSHYAQRTVILNENTHLAVCFCGYTYSVENHSYIADSTVISDSSYIPITKVVTCEDCGYKRTLYEINTEYDIHRVVNNERIRYKDILTFDCLYYEFSFVSPECVLYILDESGKLYKTLALPSLKVGEKILIDTQTGYYSIWSDKVTAEKTLIEGTMVRDVNGNYFEFIPDDGTLPTNLDKYNSYFESDYLEKYNYPVIDYNLRWQNYDYICPYAVHAANNNKVQLRSFPQETLSELISDLQNYPLTFVLYDYTNQTLRSVSSSSDNFVASYARLKEGSENTNTPSEGFGGGNTGDMGGSYAQGYADAYNTLTNAVIEKAPIQGFIQGMWYGVLAMVTILGNGISIGGVSLFSIVISLLIVVVFAFVLKLLFKGAG